MATYLSGINRATASAQNAGARILIFLKLALMQQHPRSTFNTADLRLGCLSYSASALWYLGYSDQALKRIHEALPLAQELAHPFSLAFALHWAGGVYQHRREGQATQKWTEAEIALATEQGFPFWLAGGTRLRGWALVEQGQLHEGITQMGKSLIAVPPAIPGRP